MSDPTRDFFTRIGEQGFDARLGHVKGTIRFEVQRQRDTESWLIALDHGAVRVSRGEGPADCVVHTDAATSDGIVEGRLNATATLLRGLVSVDGELDLLLYLQRLFPAAPEAPGAYAGAAR
ncbi:MAG: SCP2 sterol-binding domain-containing protein [Gaiellales bacterium]